MTSDTLTPVDASQRLHPNGSPQLSPSSYITTPPASPRSVEQIWDEGVDRVRQREKYRNQRLSPAAIDERLDRCSEATLLDFISGYQNRVSSTVPSRKVTSPYKDRMSHSPQLVGAATLDEEKRSDSAVSIDNQDANRPASAKISRGLYTYPQEMVLPPKPSVSLPRKAQVPVNSHQHLSPQRPSVKRVQSSMPPEPRRPSLPSANSFPAPSGVFGVQDRLPRTSSRVNILAQPLEKSATNQTSPFPSLNLNISTQSNLPPHLLPSAMFQTQDSFASTPFSSATTSPLPSPHDVYFFPTPPGSSCGNGPLMFSSRPASSHTSPLSQLQPTLKSVFDDDDEDEDPSVMEKWKKSLQLRRTPRSRKGSMPELATAEDREKELQKILGGKHKAKRERFKTSWSAGCCSCFGSQD